MMEENPIDWDQPFHNLLHESHIETTKDFYNAIQLVKSTSASEILLCSCSDSNDLQLYGLPTDLDKHFRYYQVENGDENASTIPSDAKFIPLHCYSHGEKVYDYRAFLPNNLDAVRLILTSRDHPIQLIDPSNGRNLASYVGKNHLDELDPSLSITLNTTQDKVFAGADCTIRCFDLNTSDCSPLFTVETCQDKRSFFGQKGLISTLSFNPDQSGIYAAGSFLGNVSIYSETALASSFLDIAALGYGVNHMTWSPCGRYLWIGGRKSNEISCWDIRGTKNKVGSVTRLATTNQKTAFDLDPWGQFLAAGDQDGNILVYDTRTFEPKRKVECVTGCTEMMHTCLFHPYSAMMITAQGERQFEQPMLSDSDSENSVIETHTGESMMEEVDSLAIANNRLGITLWGLNKHKRHENESSL
jgi:WD40 repeat protein